MARLERIVCIGDSTTVGAGAGIGDVYTGARARSYPSRLAALLTARTESLFGAGGRHGCALSVFDRRADHGPGWVADLDERAFSLGGPAFRGEFGDFVFRPEGHGDVVDLILAGGPVQLCADGQPVGQEVRRDGSVRKASFDLGGLCLAPTLTIAPLDGPTLLIGMEFKNGSADETTVLNVGAGGCSVGGWARTDRKLLPRCVLPLLEPDLCIVSLGTNDAMSDLDVTRFQGALGGVVDGVTEAGSACILVVPPASDPAAISEARQASFAAAIEATALRRETAFVDIPAVLGGFSDMKARGMMFDAFHPNAAGYRAIAGIVAAEILRPACCD